MALIDVLPEFKIKPLDFSPVKSKLAPRYTEPEAETAATTPTSSTTPPSATASSATYLPDEYAEFQPLMQALDEAGVSSNEARQAVLAQMGLETGWKTPPDFNYGNITTGSSWTGAYRVRGDKDARGNPIQQKFRSYDSAKAFVDDYLQLLQNRYPKAYEAIKSDKFDIDNFSTGLVGGTYKYAEDPEYMNKIRNTFRSVQQRFLNTNNSQV